MDRKSLLALALIMLIIWLYPYYQTKILKIKPAPKKYQESSGLDSSNQEKFEQIVREKELQKDTEKNAGLSAIDSTVKGTKDLELVRGPSASLTQVTVKTNVYDITLTNKGGKIVQCQLPHYVDHADNPVRLLPEEYGGGLDVSLVSGKTEKKIGSLIMNVDKELIDLQGEDGQSDTVTFTLSTHSRVLYQKRYIFYADKYYFDTELHFSNSIVNKMESYTYTWLPGLAVTEEDFKQDLYGFGSGYKLVGEKMTRKKFKGKSAFDRGRLEWIATHSKYFTVALIPLSLINAEQECGIEFHEKEGEENKKVSFTLNIPLEKSGSAELFRVYLGPLDIKQLQDLGLGLENVVDLGWPIIRFFSVIILKLFVILHEYIPNYGVVIIVFSFLLKIVFYPLTHKSFESMRKMQELQPLLAELKAKHKDDKQTFAREQMKLFKERGVNPLGGCLPLLLQMPVFFALFKVFSTTIELRNAGFILWYKDLSQPDPFYVLPVLMGGTMFLQQKLGTGVVMSDQQKIMLYAMPIMMTIFFLNMSAGLNLYYSLFNLLSIAQQHLINRKKGATPIIN